MDPKESKLITLIREIVKAEMSNAFASILREIVSTNGKATINENKIQHKPNPIIKKTQVMKPPAAKSKKKYSSDPMLNNLLNSTGGFSSEEQYDIPDAVDAAGNQVLVDIENKPVQIDTEVMAVVAENITKDYSKLMKAINKKKGEG